MKIMIFGDTASGKSIFADRLGKKLSPPVIHLDELMDQIGREKRIGSKNYKLNLEYFIPYIFIKFPRRREKAAKLAESFGKNTVYFHNFSELEQYLEKT